MNRLHCVWLKVSQQRDEPKKKRSRAYRSLAAVVATPQAALALFPIIYPELCLETLIVFQNPVTSTGKDGSEVPLQPGLPAVLGLTCDCSCFLAFTAGTV